jgi:hypothetical protein
LVVLRNMHWAALSPQERGGTEKEELWGLGRDERQAYIWV